MLIRVLFLKMGVTVGGILEVGVTNWGHIVNIPYNYNGLDEALLSDNKNT